MSIRILIFALLSISVFACNNAVKDANANQEADAGKYFGEKITEKGVISYDELLTKMESTDSIAVKVSGKVESVCQAKGCWMNIVSEDPAKTPMFVKFKDYGFFMPKDIAGKTVIMEGFAYREVTSIDELKHYAEDEGKSKEEIAAITEPVEELKFMASGVILVQE